MIHAWEAPLDGGLYLDWNATTPPHPDVVHAMARAAECAWGNPSSVHAAGRRARAIVEASREALAEALAVDARDVVLTSGGTEANNLALAHAPGLLTSRLEHPSVVAVAERLASRGTPVRWLAVGPNGQVDPGAIASASRDLPAGSWLAVQAANHETGVLQPVRECVASAHAAGLRVHVDAVQAFGKVPLDDVGDADSVAVTAHKIRGPKSIGALAFRHGAAPRPLLLGGSQERGLRPGTVDPVGAAGFLVAVQLAAMGPSRWSRTRRHRDALEALLAPAALVNGAEPRLPHVTNLSFSAVRGDELVAGLDLLGVRASSGSACSAGSAEPSPVILSMVGKARALGALRVSLGEDVTDDQVRRAAGAIFQVLGRDAQPSSSSG